MNRGMWAKPASFVIMIITLCCVLPFFLREFHLNIAIFLLIDIILVVSFRLITTMGLFSFAHISLMGVGAYTSGLLVTQLGWSFYPALPVAVLTSALVGVLIGLPCLRSTGFQFFVTSYAAGEAIRWVWIIFEKPFGAYQGLGVIPPPNPLLGINFANVTSYYYLVLIFTVLSIGIMYWLEKSRVGDTAKASYSNPDLCKAIGVNIYRYKILLFVVASAFAGLAGVFFSHYQGTAAPNNFTFLYSMKILVFAIVGGIGSFVGPIVGAIVLTAVGELLRESLEYLPLIYGSILIVIVLFLPGGLVTLLRRMSPLIDRIQKRGTR